jgi:acyl-CoA synthetase (AMP-forming)/AMP-acid ligase II
MTSGASAFTSEMPSPLAYASLTEALLAAPPDQPFTTYWQDEDQARSVTFGEFIRHAHAHAATLQGHGVRPGDRVILIMQQDIPLMSAFAGAMLLGAVPAILAYPNFKVEPAKYRFGLAGVSRNLRAKLVAIDEAFPEHLLEHVAIEGDSRLVRLAHADLGAHPDSLPVLQTGPDDLAFIQHSAGTTGLQKGVALSHGAVLRQLDHLVNVIGITPADRIYSWLPLYHDMGLIACFMLPLVCHLPLVMQSPTDWVMQPGTMLRVITDYRCTLSWVPNFTFQFLARRVHPDDRETFDFSSVRALISCSEPVRAPSMDEFLQVYSSRGLRPEMLQSSYAMAENVFAATQSDMGGKSVPARVWIDAEQFRNEHLAVPVEPGSVGSVCFVSSGRCLPGNSIRIAAPSGEDLPPGGAGEILISSDCLFSGYYNRPDLTAEVLKNGEYWSGDLGFMLDGEVYVVGRKKDLIIVAGKNIYPQDLEEIVCRHPLVHDGRAVAMGLYNPALGTEDIVVVAEVEREEALADALAIERDLKQQVVTELGVAARAVILKPPRWIVKSTAGKAARSTTREKLLREHPELAAEDPGNLV